MEPADFRAAVGRTAGRFGMDLARPLVMVSGGPDSVALVRVLLDLGSRPVVLHVDHGLRGRESRVDAHFVEALCERLGVPVEVRRPALGEGTSLQERAREVRYRLAAEVAGGLGLRTVAVGHTADDVAETVLLNLSRGAGLRGLSGIPPVREGVVRPLIERTRAEVLGYLGRLGQPYRTDPTNLTGKYARNRVRSEVLPVLEELHPGAARNLARGAELAREDLEVLEELADEVLEKRGGEVVLPLRGLEELRPALRRHAVRRGYRTLLPGAPPLDSALVGAVLGLLEGGEGTRVLDLPGGVVAAARPNEGLVLYERVETSGEAVELQVGETYFAGWRVSVREVEDFDARDAAREQVAYLDETKGPYRMRLAREGDIIRPLGLGGGKKVLRAMMDRKVPGDLRRRTPVVVGAEGVAWIFLGELGEGFKVDRATERMLRVEVERVS
ncbi:MAG TPA: tRNA lysidine(34) synthetase TilS [Rubrobacteraceae bacterium]|nr:tRNA lysidine(34) synthetase TilS [Rubrobacteraceae bacterium]